MARDLGEQERAFIDTLAGDTGRDLPGWMQAIAASGHARRNDIIDWLRHQGFTFSNASWLERIHHNGGRLIYGEGEVRPALTERTALPGRPALLERPALPERAPSPSLRHPPGPSTPETAHESEAESAAQSAAASVERSTEPAAPAEIAAIVLEARTGEVPAPPAHAASPPARNEPAPPHAPPAPAASDEDIAAILTAAKGLRPLAEFVLREMDAVVPALVRSPAAPFLTLTSPMPFAALLPAPKELRLFADFGPHTRDRTRKAESARLTAPFPDVLVLNDVRQVDDRFRELIAQAYTRALR